MGTEGPPSHERNTSLLMGVQLRSGPAAAAARAHLEARRRFSAPVHSPKASARADNVPAAATRDDEPEAELAAPDDHDHDFETSGRARRTQTARSSLGAGSVRGSANGGVVASPNFFRTMAALVSFSHQARASLQARAGTIAASRHSGSSADGADEVSAPVGGTGISHVDIARELLTASPGPARRGFAQRFKKPAPASAFAPPGPADIELEHDDAHAPVSPAASNSAEVSLPHSVPERDPTFSDPDLAAAAAELTSSPAPSRAHPRRSTARNSGSGLQDVDVDAASGLAKSRITLEMAVEPEPGRSRLSISSAHSRDTAPAEPAIAPLIDTSVSLGTASEPTTPARGNKER
jgi:hypothetical protein